MSRCENCRFSRKHESALECHKNPPPWHPVAYGDWCSFWEVNDKNVDADAISNGHKRSRKNELLPGEAKEEARKRYKREWIKARRATS